MQRCLKMSRRLMQPIKRYSSLQKASEASNIATTQAPRNRRYIQYIPGAVLLTAGAIYFYWRYVAVENDRKHLERYIQTHHAQLIQNAVTTGLASVNDPLNIKKAIEAFGAAGEHHDPETCKLQIALMTLHSTPQPQNDPKQFFATNSTIIYSLLPEIAYMREHSVTSTNVKVKVESPFTVLQSRDCTVRVDFPITIVDSKEQVTDDKEYPVVALGVEMRNLNRRLDKFVPQFFATRITIRDARLAFPNAPAFVESREAPNKHAEHVIEESASVDGLIQVGNGILQKKFNWDVK